MVALVIRSKVTSARCQWGGTGSKEVLRVSQKFPPVEHTSNHSKLGWATRKEFLHVTYFVNKWEQFSMLETKRRHCEGNIWRCRPSDANFLWIEFVFSWSFYPCPEPELILWKQKAAQQRATFMLICWRYAVLAHSWADRIFHGVRS